MHSQLCYLLQICVPGTKLAIYSAAAAAWNAVYHSQKKRGSINLPNAKEVTSHILMDRRSGASAVRLTMLTLYGYT